MDTSFGTIEDVERIFRFPILGIIPKIKIKDSVLKGKAYHSPRGRALKEQREKLVTIYFPKSQEAESFKALRINLIQIFKEKNKKLILFTSSDQGEGKSTVITNVAVSMAQLGKKTLLVGSNLRRPTIFKIFGLERKRGLTDILMGRLAWQEVVKKSTDIFVGDLDMEKFLEMPGIDNLSIITCGHSVPNPSELLNSPRIDKLFNDLREQFDVILIDCSPILPVPDSLTLSSRVDGVVLIYKAGYTKKEVLKRASVHMQHVNAEILGLVLNQIKAEAQMGPAAYTYRYYGEADRYENNIFRKILKKLFKFGQ